MAPLFPSLDARRVGHLEVDGGHAVYYEECGSEAGLPVLFLHGGPGSCINAGQRRYFDPAVFRIILFDQRGCGRSRPRGGVNANTTQDLIEDIERLRVHFGIERWVLFGGSWGSTLALCYALAHPSRVLGMVLRGIFLASAEELRWYCEGLRAFVPEAWTRMTAGIDVTEARNILAHYANALAHGDSVRAAREWSAYESSIMAIGEAMGGGVAAQDDALIDRARVQLHYLVQGCFLTRPLLDAVGQLTQPCIIVQGRRDLVCPPVTAHALHHRLRGSELVMVEDGGHSAMHPAMAEALVRAVHRLVDRLGAHP